MQVKFLKRFLKTESAGGLFLLISACLAIILANSPYSSAYETWSRANHFVINEALMALFFLVVGLELKREFSQKTTELGLMRLAAIAALGGMLIPGIIYILVNINSAETLNGWAIPVATDIAFALGALSLCGHRVPTTLKIFLMTLAIFDDIGAILIIAVFYTDGLSLLYLSLACVITLALFFCNKKRYESLFIYFGLGALLWYALFLTGIHPTLAGVLLGLAIPSYSQRGKPLLSTIETQLHPWVVFGIMPLFALCNAGFPLSINQLHQIIDDPIILGTILGLFIGKQLGVFGFTYITIRLKWATPLKQISWLALYGISLLCGIGFTMSLFLGTLAFAGPLSSHLNAVRLGVLCGSLLSGAVGIFVLRLALSKESSGRT